jgi:hypothetical protein
MHLTPGSEHLSHVPISGHSSGRLQYLSEAVICGSPCCGCQGRQVSRVDLPFRHCQVLPGAQAGSQQWSQFSGFGSGEQEGQSVQGTQLGSLHPFAIPHLQVLCTDHRRSFLVQDVFHPHDSDGD